MPWLFGLDSAASRLNQPNLFGWDGSSIYGLPFGGGGGGAGSGNTNPPPAPGPQIPRWAFPEYTQKWAFETPDAFYTEPPPKFDAANYPSTVKTPPKKK